MTRIFIPILNRYISVRIKLAVIFGILFTLIYAVVFAWFYTFAVDVAKTQVNASLLNALTVTAGGIDGDKVVALYNEAEPILYTDRDDDDPENDVYFTGDARFWEIAQWLYTVHQIDFHAYPYVYVAGGDPEDPSSFQYVVDGLSLSAPIPEWMVDFKEIDQSDQGWVFQGLERTVTFLDEPYEWRGIQWVSGYTPIYNDAGEVVAGLGIDYTADYIIAVERNVQNAALPAFVVTFAIMFVLVYLASRIVATPIVRLADVAERVGEGNYDIDILRDVHHPFPDEIVTLTETLGAMVEKVRQREVALKQQVEDLRIQIDHSRRDEQVQEIVEDDFFQQLQSRAGQMRERRRTGVTPPAVNPSDETSVDPTPTKETQT